MDCDRVQACYQNCTCDACTPRVEVLFNELEPRYIKSKYIEKKYNRLPLPQKQAFMHLVLKG